MAALTPNHGYVRPDLIDEAGLAEMFDEAMASFRRRCTTLLTAEYPNRRRTPWRWRTGCGTSCSSTLARRSTCSSSARRRKGIPSYRRVALEMHELIARQAGHRAIADAMIHMTTEAPELERLESERRAESAASQR